MICFENNPGRQRAGFKTFMHEIRCALICTAIFTFSIQASAGAKKPLPDQVFNAKSIYIDNETGDKGVLETATKTFEEWGRFTISDKPEEADLIVRFTRKNGVDKFGNMGFIVMDVLLKDHTDPAFQAKSALHIIVEPQRRTIACITDFSKRLEAKN